MSVIAAGVITAAVGLSNATALGSDRVLELRAGSADVMASCLPFDVETLAAMSVAFEGVVSEVDGAVVALSVKRWFAGGDETTVKLVGEHESPALIAGFEFEPGAKYLISATGGEVNYCGFSGPSTPELVSGFEAAFGV